MHAIVYVAATCFGDIILPSSEKFFIPLCLIKCLLQLPEDGEIIVPKHVAAKCKIVHLTYRIVCLSRCIICVRRGKGLPQQAESALGVPGRLRPRIFLTIGSTSVVGRQP